MRVEEQAMCRAQKEALFNVIIVALSLATVLTLYPFTALRAGSECSGS